MNSKIQLSGPVAVGGLGGSGTRVVAEILLRLGFYLGRNLNRSQDNLWFTLLFRRPEWFIKNFNSTQSQIFMGLSIFEKTMMAELPLTLEELTFILRAVFEYRLLPSRKYSNKKYQPWLVAKSMLWSNRIDLSKYAGWGWKEPNTHLYVEYLSKYFDQRIKYIHVIRHGLDMAYSKNQKQVYNWAQLYGIYKSDTPKLANKVCLEYWIKANEKAIALGKLHLGDRFLIINFDELCSTQEKEVTKLLKFLELESSSIDMVDLASVPKRPRSTGRYKKHDLSIFEKDQIDAVQRLGFEVDV